MTLDDLLKEHLDSLDGDFVVAIEAQKFVTGLREQNPKALREWLDANAETLISQRIQKQLQSQRTILRTAMGSERFREWSESENPGPFQIVYEISDDHVRRHVADMIGPDHQYVANSYVTTGNRALMLAEFHKAVAKRIGRRRTADVFDEDEYSRLMLSITGEHAQAI